MSLPMALFVYGQNLPLLTQVSRGWISSRGVAALVGDPRRAALGGLIASPA